MTQLFQAHTRRFDTITLEQLNQRAALLDRRENKYLLTSRQFVDVLGDLAADFDILKIGGKTVFKYMSTYFDTPGLIGYNYHHQGRIKRRFKVRTRQYVDSGLCFFEVKLKDKRGGTIKKRIPYDVSQAGGLNQTATTFLKAIYKQVYHEPFRFELQPQLEVNYNRITLVAKAGGERMTIDYNLEFRNESSAVPVRQMIIVETKSSTGRGLADAAMRRRGIRGRSCSKFCLAANLLGYRVKSNRFKPLLKLYHALPAVTKTSGISALGSRP